MNKIQKSWFILNQGLNNCMQKTPYLKRFLAKPSFIYIEVTNSCNLKCKSCNIWKYKTKDISTKKIKRIIKDLRKWLGPFHLSFSGGEPLLREDIAELVKLSSKLGIMTNLITNGTLLDKEMTKKLSDSNLNLLTISLDGTKETIHDYIRGVKGTYRKVMKNICYSKNKLQIKIATLVLNNNLDELVPLTKWTKNNSLFGIEFQSLQHKFGKRYQVSWHKSDRLWPKDNKKTGQIIDSLIKLKKQGYPILNTNTQLQLFKRYYKNPMNALNSPCMAGTKSAKISSEGKLYFCRFPLKDITKENIHSVWNSKERPKVQNLIKECKRRCIISCNFEKSLIQEAYQFFRRI